MPVEWTQHPNGSGEVVRWADEAMYVAEATPTVPRVTLLNMTPDPLKTIAAAAELYRGGIVRDVRLIGEEQALAWLHDMEKTTLNAALEFVHFHFLIEGVTRGFTHQLVRQRTAVYVQESTRFAVKEDAGTAVALPPSLAGLPDDHPWRVIWDAQVKAMGVAYNDLVNAGMPAEDARGLLPTNICTRVHYNTNLRSLVDHAGMRLCSQAQHEWKQVWAAFIKAILDYPQKEPWVHTLWQNKAIVSLFKPICYQTGRCEFRAATDRHCAIRDRVEAHYARGEEPETWSDIDPREPLVEGAARQRGTFTGPRR
jgi:flavin-dependent thymidylate synthase